jgi:hypothetical protein
MIFKIKIVAVIIVVVAVGLFVYKHQQTNPVGAAKTAAGKVVAKAAASSAVAKITPVNNCASNTEAQAIIVSISKQHMWACNSTSAAYDNPVVTGMEMYSSELTPVGTYKIYGKLTDQTLTGSDFTGHWSDYVYYWMPFLSNQYGIYGFHDLTNAANGANGRAESDFGNIDINALYTAAKHGSHGCVEMPLAAAKWLYNWASVGTTVTIET